MDTKRKFQFIAEEVTKPVEIRNLYISRIHEWAKKFNIQEAQINELLSNLFKPKPISNAKYHVGQNIFIRLGASDDYWRKGIIEKVKTKYRKNVYQVYAPDPNTNTNGQWLTSRDSCTYTDLPENRIKGEY